MRQGSGVGSVMAIGIGLLLVQPSVFAAEHGGKEHEGATHEHGGASAESAPASNTATTAATVTTQAASNQPKPMFTELCSGIRHICIIML